MNSKRTNLILRDNGIDHLFKSKKKLSWLKKPLYLLNNQKRGGRTLAPRNLVTFAFFPGEEQLDNPGLMQSEAGSLLGDILIYLLGAYLCWNNHLKGLSMWLPKILQI